MMSSSAGLRYLLRTSGWANSRIPLQLKIPRRSAQCTSFTYRTHTCGELRSEDVGKNVVLCGWVKRPRVVGSQGSAFIPLTDSSGVTQLVCDSQQWSKVLNSLKSESVVKATGTVQHRPDQNQNKALPTGSVEVDLTSLEVLNEAHNIPFSMSGKEPAVTEELRLRERQLDLRRPTLQQNLRLRSQIAMATREFLIHQHNFVEIETPTLFRKTSEGAREFVVPTRKPGQFYTLTQSPQQFKQLLMVGGFDRYFQFARCYRDEDQRADRQPEFTQIDLEMSFVSTEGVMSLTEQLLAAVISDSVPDLRMPSPPFPRIPYVEAMEKYGTDKPDTRYGMELKNLDDIWEIHPQDQRPAHMQAFKVPQWKEVWMSLGRREKAKLRKELDQMSYGHNIAFVTSEELKPFDDTDIPDGVHRAITDQSSEIHRGILEKTNSSCSDLCVVGTSEIHSNRESMLTTLGSLRTQMASVLANRGHLGLDPKELNFLWVLDFPLFTITRDQRTGSSVVESTHHPFTAPLPEHEQLLSSPGDTHHNLSQVKGQHYDLVVNGVELGGGSIRIHQAHLQEHVLKNILHVPVDEFSHLLKGLRSGCPPHGGIALGFDRLMAILCQAGSLRDVIAFPKSFKGKDLLTGAPSDLSDSELSDYCISTVKRETSRIS